MARPRNATLPAHLAERARIIRNAYGREPTAEDLGVTEQQLAEWSEGTLFIELDAGNADDGEDRRGTFQLSADNEEAKHVVDKLLLETAWTDAVSELSERNASIAEAIFWQGKTYREVGDAFGLSAPEVLRIAERVEARLKRAVKRATGAPPSSKRAA
jgi:DNA-directed RNA polymerase specialized sigma subunit